MAILDSLQGVEVSMWSEGSKLTEYHDDDDEVRSSWKHKTVSNYIESVTDTEFFFRLKVGDPYEHDCDELGFSIILDGCEENIDSILCSPNDLEEEDGWEYDMHGVETHDTEGAKLKRFKFCKLHTTDGETRYITRTEVEDLQKIGQIEVRVHQLAHCRSTKRKPKQLRGALGVLPEKFFGGQAISHSVSYEVEERLSAPSFYQGTKYMHGWDGPIGVFRFKYRSRDDLQKELIIPRTPSPEPPGPASVAALTSEQKLRLARMKYDDTEMLKSLTGPVTNSQGQSSTSTQRSFEDLNPEEIDLLALQKHAEMTGAPIIKPEPGITIKQEPGIRNATAIGSSDKRRRPFPMIQLGNGKRAVDLTSDDEDEPGIRHATPQSDSGSKSSSISGSVGPNLTPSSKSSVCPDDEDEPVVYASRRLKKPKTRVEGRRFVPKKEP